MKFESTNTQAERFFTLLHYLIEQRMPRPGGIHRYSKGSMLRGLQTRQTKTGWEIIVSQGVDYSSFALGYKEDGSKRSPRGPLETINFQTIEKCINQASKICGIKYEGSVRV